VKALRPFLIASFMLSLSAPTAEARDRPTTTPAPVSDARWVRLFADQKRQLANKIDICLVGDSLTEFWNETGNPILQLEFAGLRMANLGIAADRTEHILYRVNHLDFSKADPEVFVILAGTNNLAKSPADSPEDTASGVAAIVDAIRLKSDRPRIILLSILPNGYESGSELRKRIVETNALLQKIPDTKYLDIHDQFIEQDGKWKSGLTLDGTHLTLQGYDLLGRLISPEVKNPK